MVNNDVYLNNLFGALSDPTRRNILQRLMEESLSVGQIAERYAISIPAVSKHLTMLEKARLVVKRKAGKERIISIEPAALQEASLYLAQYEKLWNARFNRLEHYLKEKS